MTEKHCPRCGGAKLEPIQIDPVTLFRCAKCGGSFLGTSQFDKLVELAKAGNAPVVEPPDARPKNAALRDPIGCPVCGKPMKTIEHGEREKVLVDVCRSDGIWLDGGEIAAIVDDERQAREGQQAGEETKRDAKDVGTDVAVAVGGGLLEVLGDIVVGLF